MLEETSLHPKNFIYPLFILEGKNQKIEIATMKNQFRWSLDKVLPEIEELMNLGINSFALFPVVQATDKNKMATKAVDNNFFYLESIASIKKNYPSALIMTDVALDPYSSDGHDGLVCSRTGTILNDETVDVLVKMSLLQAQAGADIIAPSDMMDGRVGAIRQALEKNRHQDKLIMSYCAKYASSFYGPFRDALDSAPKHGDKKTYQMDYHNVVEALKEAALDEEEGADILMVKPGLPYLDVIYRLKQTTHLPVAAYQVSGEYAMIKAADKLGCGDNEGLMLETLTALKRAGADIIISYFAKEFAQWFHRKK